MDVNPAVGFGHYTFPEVPQGESKVFSQKYVIFFFAVNRKKLSYYFSYTSLAYLFTPYVEKKNKRLERRWATGSLRSHLTINMPCQLSKSGSDPIRILIQLRHQITTLGRNSSEGEM